MPCFLFHVSLKRNDTTNNQKAALSHIENKSTALGSSTHGHFLVTLYKLLQVLSGPSSSSAICGSNGCKKQSKTNAELF